MIQETKPVPINISKPDGKAKLSWLGNDPLFSAPFLKKHIGGLVCNTAVTLVRLQ